MIAYWPAVIKDPGRISRVPGHFIDIMATFVDITGAEYPEYSMDQEIYTYEGMSMFPVFKSETVQRNKPLFWKWAKGSAMLKDNWKIVNHGQDKPWDLYDVEMDPSETTNLADKYPEKVEEMDGMFREWELKWDSRQ
jgi:arylsulfatase